MKIKSLAHVCIKTRDLKRTLEFYCGLLGFKKAFDFTRKGEVIGFYLQAANATFIEVFHSDFVPPLNADRALHHFCLETDSLDELHRKVCEAGYCPREIIMGADGTLQFWVQDPNGLDLEFQQYTKRSSQLTGAAVEVE